MRKQNCFISIRWKHGNFFRRAVLQEESQSRRYKGKWWIEVMVGYDKVHITSVPSRNSKQSTKKVSSEKEAGEERTGLRIEGKI